MPDLWCQHGINCLCVSWSTSSASTSGVMPPERAPRGARSRRRPNAAVHPAQAEWPETTIPQRASERNRVVFQPVRLFGTGFRRIITRTRRNEIVLEHLIKSILDGNLDEL